MLKITYLLIIYKSVIVGYLIYKEIFLISDNITHGVMIK